MLRNCYLFFKEKIKIKNENVDGNSYDKCEL